ncbi:MAG TPA: septum formation initiator family protein [Vicinamibacterales bacterium]|nr:septum formation initiator family protein [Vicinamibacterales bacterium]
MVQADDTPLVKPVPRRRDRPWLRRLMVFVTVVLFVDALFGDHGLAETLRARRQYADAAASLAALRAENDRLRDRARRLVEDARTIEAEARKQLGLVKPGEILFVVRNR